ncbi:hypothetical protein Tco_0305445 [Tanacetum coccineum]
MGEFGLSVHRSGGSICSGVVRRGVAQSGQRICFGFLLGINRFTLRGLGLRHDKAVAPPSTRRESRRLTCPRVEEFDDWPSLQKIPELVDSESAGLEESGATRIFNGFESLLIPGGRPNSMEFAISQACRLSKERPVIKRAPFSVDEIRMKGIISTMLFSGLLFKISFWPAVLGGYYSFLSIEPLSPIPLVQPFSRTCTIDATEIAKSIIEKNRKGAAIWHQISEGMERAAVRSGKPSKTMIIHGGFHRKTLWFWQTDHNYSMESAKHWELPGEELGTGTRRSENHLNGGIDCILSFVPHSNWGLKSIKFDDLLRERRSKSMLLKTLQDMPGRPPLIVYEQNTCPKGLPKRVGLVPHLNDNSKPYLDQENLDDIIVYSHSLEVWNPEYSVVRVAGKEAMDQEIMYVLDWEVPKKERAGSNGEAGCSKQFLFFMTGRLQGEHRDAISLEREASRACCRGDPITFMNVEECGIFLVTVPMFRRTNVAGGVQNRPAEDGRVHVVEPRAREALKKGGGDGRLYSESMPELDNAKMLIDAVSSDNIVSTEMVDQLGLGKRKQDVWCEVVPMDYISYSEDHELAKEKGVGIAFLDVEEESIECYALIAKPTSRVEVGVSLLCKAASRLSLFGNEEIRRQVQELLSKGRESLRPCSTPA